MYSSFTALQAATIRRYNRVAVLILTVCAGLVGWSFGAGSWTRAVAPFVVMVVVTSVWNHEVDRELSR